MDNKGTLKQKGSNRLQRILRSRELGVFCALLVLVVMFSFMSNVFFTLNNILNIIRQVSLVGIMSVGMVMIIVCGEFDMSVGSIFGFSAMFSAHLITNLGVPILPTVLISLAISIIIGIMNGALIGYGRIPSFIVTVGMLNVVRGAALLLTGGNVINVSARTLEDPLINAFLFIGNGKLFGCIPFMSVLYLAIIIIGYFVFHKALLGFRFRAVGGNINAAKITGINVNIIKIKAFAIMGLLAGIAGTVDLAFLGSVQGTLGEGMELTVIAATVIGGASLKGGEGSIIGTVLGVFIMGVLKNGLVLVGVSAYLQLVFTGLIIIGSVAIDMWTKKK